MEDIKLVTDDKKNPPEEEEVDDDGGGGDRVRCLEMEGEVGGLSTAPVVTYAQN